MSAAKGTTYDGLEVSRAPDRYNPRPRIGLRCTIALAVEAHALTLVAAYAMLTR